MDRWQSVLVRWCRKGPKLIGMELSVCTLFFQQYIAQNKPIVFSLWGDQRFNARVKRPVCKPVICSSVSQCGDSLWGSLASPWILHKSCLCFFTLQGVLCFFGFWFMNRCFRQVQTHARTHTNCVSVLMNVKDVLSHTDKCDRWMRGCFSLVYIDH